MRKKALPAEKKKRAKGQTLWTVLTSVSAVLTAGVMIAGPIANNYASIINMVLGTETTKTIGDEGETYFTADFKNSADQAAAAENIVEQLVANGSVLMLDCGMESAAMASAITNRHTKKMAGDLANSPVT